MRTYDVSDCVVEFMRHRDMVAPDYLLYGAGRALGWLKMSADEIDELPNDQKTAEYHGYAGISAARTTLDALASWINTILDLGCRGSGIDFKKERFVERIRERGAPIINQAKSMGTLATVIDVHRQRAQHREGLAVIFYNAAGTDAQGGWHLAPRGLQEPRQEDLHLPTMLREWAASLEEKLCSTIEALAD